MTNCIIKAKKEMNSTKYISLINSYRLSCIVSFVGFIASNYRVKCTVLVTGSSSIIMAKVVNRYLSTCKLRIQLRFLQMHTQLLLLIAFVLSGCLSSNTFKKIANFDGNEKPLVSFVINKLWFFTYNNTICVMFSHLA